MSRETNWLYLWDALSFWFQTQPIWFHIYELQYLKIKKKIGIDHTTKSKKSLLSFLKFLNFKYSSSDAYKQTGGQK